MSGRSHSGDIGNPHNLTSDQRGVSAGAVTVGQLEAGALRGESIAPVQWRRADEELEGPGHKGGSGWQHLSVSPHPLRSGCSLRKEGPC